MAPSSQIFPDRQSTEGAAPFGDMRNAQTGDGLRLTANDRTAIDANASSCTDDSRNCPQRRGFPGTVCAEQGGDTAFRDREVDAMQRFYRAIERAQIFDFENVGHHAATPR